MFVDTYNVAINLDHVKKMDKGVGVHWAAGGEDVFGEDMAHALKEIPAPVVPAQPGFFVVELHMDFDPRPDEKTIGFLDIR